MHTNRRHWLRWTLAALLVFYVISRPAQAADTATGLLDKLGTVATSATTFVSGVGR